MAGAGGRYSSAGQHWHGFAAGPGVLGGMEVPFPGPAATAWPWEAPFRGA